MLATTNVTFVHGDGYKLQHIHVRFDHNERSHYKLPYIVFYLKKCSIYHE